MTTPTYPERRTLRTYRWETLYPCYTSVAAQCIQRRLRSALTHYGLRAPVVRVSLDGTALRINCGPGVRPDLLDAVITYAHSDRVTA